MAAGMIQKRAAGRILHGHTGRVLDDSPCETGDSRSFPQRATVIAPDSDRQPMVLNYAGTGAVLLISALIMTGCTGSSPLPVVTTQGTRTVAVTVSGTPAPTAITALATFTAGIPTARTTQPGPVTDRPYWKMYTFEGTGDFPHTFTTDSDRTWAFRMHYPGSEDFTVRLHDDHGKTIQVLADTWGPYTGTRSLWLEAGTYTLDVLAGSPWTISMSTG